MAKETGKSARPVQKSVDDLVVIPEQEQVALARNTFAMGENTELRGPIISNGALSDMLRRQDCRRKSFPNLKDSMDVDKKLDDDDLDIFIAPSSPPKKTESTEDKEDVYS